jgi:AraC-like DNA-binding protein
MGRQRDEVRYWRLEALDGLEFLHASYVTQRFVKHSHETFSIGIIERGVNSFYYRRCQQAASAGSICAVNPGEIHTGEPGPNGWTYWNFYPSAATLERVAEEISDRPVGLPDLRSGVIEDVIAAGLLLQMFAAFVKPVSNLERDTRLVEALAWIIRHHADLPCGPRMIKVVPAVIHRSVEYLDAHSDENVSLAELAELTGMSRFHFLRSFRSAMGLPPHAYLTHRRLVCAKAMLLEGEPIAGAAIAAGFADQAHLSRHFKRTFGVSPGRWLAASNNIQN